MNKAIEMFSWEKNISKQKYSQLKLFNEKIINIVYNCIPNKCITYNDKDSPWWNDHIKCVVNLKIKIFKKYLKNERPNSVHKDLQTIACNLTEVICSTKNAYYKRLANKLNNSYDFVKNILVNNQNPCKQWEVPVIPSILNSNKLVTNFKDKANIFNDFFSKQCHPIPNNSTPLSIQTFEASNRLSHGHTDSKKILKLIQCLNSNKAHGHNNISIRMPKLYGPSIIKPISLLFSNCIRDRFLLISWKKANIISA